MLKKKPTSKKRISRAQKNVRRLVDLKELTGYSVETYGHGEIAFFPIKPSNLSVLSPEGVRAQVNALMHVLKGIADIALLCLSSRENYAENKEYLRRRIEEEENENIRNQLQQDILILDAEQTSMATAREFFIVLHLSGDNKLEYPSYLSHVEQVIREQGFTVRRAEPEDIMRILAMYLEQNVTSDRLEAFDGERFVVV